MLYKGTIIYVESNNQLMKCKEDTMVSITNVMGYRHNPICTIHIPTKTLLSQHLDLFEDLEYVKLDYPFYVVVDNKIQYFKKRTPLLLIDL